MAVSATCVYPDCMTIRICNDPKSTVKQPAPLLQQGVLGAFTIVRLLSVVEVLLQEDSLVALMTDTSSLLRFLVIGGRTALVFGSGVAAVELGWKLSLLRPFQGTTLV